MNNRQEIVAELKEISALLSELKGKETRPAVPAGYFEINKQKLEHAFLVAGELAGISPLIASARDMEKEIKVPSNYFEKLADNLIARIKAGNILKQDAHIPEGYFENFADTILEKIGREDTAGNASSYAAREKIIRIFGRVALAASIAGILFFSLRNLNTPAPEDTCEDGIACLTKEEIFNYMNAHSQEFTIDQVQELVKPQLDNSAPKLGIDQKDAAAYIEQHENILDVDDASTDIF
jgi:hypothetical protein